MKTDARVERQRRKKGQTTTLKGERTETERQIEGRREGGRERGREGGREAGRVGKREGGRKGRREG